MNIKANEIIDTLGGTKTLALFCNVSKAAVSQWRSNGIPNLQYQLLLFTKKKQMKLIDEPHLALSTKK